jgi:quinolinate synthase
MSTQFFPDYSLLPEQVPLVGRLALDDSERDQLKAQIAEKLEVQGAVLIAHYYVDGDIQDLAEQTGGFVSDSLEMARFGRDHQADNLVVVGVRFMGETAKILSPEKKCIYAHVASRVFLRLGLSARRFCPVYSSSPRSHCSGLRQYFGQSKGAGRLGGNQ